MRTSHEGLGNAAGVGSSHSRVTARGVEWARRRVALVAGVATIASLGIAVPAHADDTAPAGPAVSAETSAPVTVLVTPAQAAALELLDAISGEDGDE